MALPRLISGGLAVDDRGELAFVNDFRLDGIKRFYVVENYRQGTVRAWHAHRREEKYILVVDGAAIVAAVEIDNWEHPSREAKVHRFVLSANQPSILHIPRGHANGFMTLTPRAKLIFFSTSTLEQSREDDIRYDARYWDPWQVVER
jgi:dTDP-4-dehydrorhamnose 3,5-epimerase-like enzyme